MINDLTNIEIDRRNALIHPEVLNSGNYSISIYHKKINGAGIFEFKIKNSMSLVLNETVKSSSAIQKSTFDFSCNGHKADFIFETSFPGKINISRVVMERKSSKNMTESQKRIGFVIPYAMYGGAEVYVKNIIEMLVGLNIVVDLIYINKNPLENIIECDYVRHINCKYFRNFKNYILSFQYSVLFFYNSKNVFDKVRESNINLNTKIVEIIHSDLEWSDSISPLEDRNHVDEVIKIHEALHPNIERYKFMPPMVNHHRFKPGQRNRKIVGTVARFSNEKNLFYILELAKILRDHKFIVVGEGNLKEEFIRKISAFGLTNVSVQAFTLQVENWYKQFGLFLLPSHVEGLPITILEAMSCNIPVVAPNIGGISGLISEGLVCELTRNPLEDANLIKNMIRNNLETRDYIIENYSYEVGLKRFKEIIAEKSLSVRPPYLFEKIMDCYYE